MPYELFFACDLQKLSLDNLGGNLKKNLIVVYQTINTSLKEQRDNATANRTARAQENNRLGLGRELGRVARKSDLAKNNRTCGM